MSIFKQYTLLLLVAVTLLFGACQPNPDLRVNSSQLYLQESAGIRADYVIPLASDEELAALVTKGGNVLDYRIARKTAIISFETSYRESMGLPMGVRFSERPVVIYNAQSEPELYEFFVLQEGEPVATVTTFTKPEYFEIIRNVLPYVRDFTPYTTKYGGFKQINNIYPSSVFVGAITKNGSGPVSQIIDPETNDTISDATNTAKEKLPKNMQEVVDGFWDILLKNSEQLLAVSDDELYAKLSTREVRYERRFETTYMGKKFDGFDDPTGDKAIMANSRWSGWCTPSASAMLLWVWGDGKYNNVKLETYDKLPKYPDRKLISKVYDFRNAQGKAITDLEEIRRKGIEQGDNNLYYDLIKKFGVNIYNASTRSYYFPGAAVIQTAAPAIHALSKGGINYYYLGASAQIIHDYMRDHDAVAMDTIGGMPSGGFHVRLLIGGKFYRDWYQTWWYTYYSYIARWYLKDGWLWTADWQQGRIYWETAWLPGQFGYDFLVWDNGVTTSQNRYFPHWENSYTVARSDAVGFRY